MVCVLARGWALISQQDRWTAVRPLSTYAAYGGGPCDNGAVRLRWVFEIETEGRGERIHGRLARGKALEARRSRVPARISQFWTCADRRFSGHSGRFRSHEASPCCGEALRIRVVRSRREIMSVARVILE